MQIVVRPHQVVNKLLDLVSECPVGERAPGADGIARKRVEVSLDVFGTTGVSNLLDVF